MKKTYIELTLI